MRMSLKYHLFTLVFSETMIIILIIHKSLCVKRVRIKHENRVKNAYLTCGRQNDELSTSMHTNAYTFRFIYHFRVDRKTRVCTYVRININIYIIHIYICVCVFSCSYVCILQFYSYRAQTK